MCRARAFLVLVLAVSGGGCHRDKPPPPPDPLAIPATVAEIALPTSAATDHPNPALRIYLTRRELVVGAQSVATLPADPDNGFDASLKRNGRNDLFIVPLSKALHGEQSALLYVDQGTRYRMITEVLYTLGQSDIKDWYIATTGATGIAALRVTAPDACGVQMAMMGVLPPDDIGDLNLGALAGGPIKPGRGTGGLAGIIGDASSPSPPPSPVVVEPAIRRPSKCPPVDLSKPRLALTVIIIPDGFSVKAVGGNVAPGCNDVGPGVAVPLAGAKYDFETLTSCVRRLKGTYPDFAAERQLTISASAQVTAQTLVQTMAATMGDDAGVLLPDIALGVVR